MKSASEPLKLRQSPRKAGEAFCNIVAEPYRKSVARMLARSIEACNGSAPNKWGLRISDSSVMLKAGMVELVQCLRQDRSPINVKTDALPKRFRAKRSGKLEPPNTGSRYKHLPDCDRWVSDYAAIKDEFEELFPAHLEAIKIACKSKINMSTARTHSPGLTEYISSVTGKTLPQPAYDMPELSQNFYPDELPHNATFEDGAVSQVLVNRYERDPQARAQCVKHHGARCDICGMSFAETYGPEFDGFIHVHHLRQLAKHNVQKIDPIRDLRPVCPNCHAVIHFSNSTRDIDEVKEMLAKFRKTDRRK